MSYAVAETQIDGAVSWHQDAKTALAAMESRNLYVAHTGCDNASGVRPGSGGTDNVAADYDTLIANVTAADALIPLPLTKRLYDRAASGYPNYPTDVVQGEVASEENGSLPYNR